MSMCSDLAMSLILGGILLSTAALAEGPKVTVYKSPTCGCCTKWISHLEGNAFEVEAVDLNDLRALKSMSGIPPEQESCHTAQVDGYVIEGHVPANDIEADRWRIIRFLRTL